MIKLLMKHPREVSHNDKLKFAEEVRKYLDGLRGMELSTTNLVKDLLGDLYDQSNIKNNGFKLLNGAVNAGMLGDCYHLAEPVEKNIRGKSCHARAKIWHQSNGEIPNPSAPPPPRRAATDDRLERIEKKLDILLRRGTHG